MGLSCVFGAILLWICWQRGKVLGTTCKKLVTILLDHMAFIAIDLALWWTLAV